MACRSRPVSDAVMPDVETVSVRQAARFLGIGERSVRYEIRKGTWLPGYTIGRRPLLRVDRARLLELAGYPPDYHFAPDR